MTETAQHLKDVIQGRIGFAEWFHEQIWHLEGLWQLLACLAAVGIGYVLARRVFPHLVKIGPERPVLKMWTEERLPGFLTPLIAMFLIHAAFGVSTVRGWPTTVTELGLKFSEGWLVVQLFASVLLPPGWTRVVVVAVGLLFALQLFGVLEPFLSYLDKLALTFDNERVSMLEIVKAMALLAVLLPLINKFCELLEAALARLADIKPRVRVLLAKLTKTGLYIVAVGTALDLVGIDLQMLTVFSGAVGIGVGFGLQKVVSNLVSGMILLLDNSVKPGDVIEVGGVYGWVESMNARFASILTRDGKSILVPNDDFVSGRVVNWSYTGPNVRLKIPVSVSYSTDLKLAMELMLRAAEDKERVLANPKPNVLLIGFGDNGVNLELRLWMTHPEKGVRSVASAVQSSIWEFFNQNGIEFPFPQRDLNLKEPLKVQVEYLKPGQDPED